MTKVKIQNLRTREQAWRNAYRKDTGMEYSRDDFTLDTHPVRSCERSKIILAVLYGTYDDQSPLNQLRDKRDVLEPIIRHWLNLEETELNMLVRNSMALIYRIQRDLYIPDICIDSFPM